LEKVVGSVSTIASSRINAQFVKNTLMIMSLTNKDEIVTSFVGWNQNKFLM
jgi:hypothetical protein